MDGRQVGASHEPTERERRRGQLARSKKPLGTYLLTQDKQGEPVTEQKGGSHRQKENNKKAHLNHASKVSHTEPREAAGARGGGAAAGADPTAGAPGR